MRHILLFPGFFQCYSSYLIPLPTLSLVCLFIFFFPFFFFSLSSNSLFIRKHSCPCEVWVEDPHTCSAAPCFLPVPALITLYNCIFSSYNLPFDRLHGSQSQCPFFPFSIYTSTLHIVGVL